MKNIVASYLNLRRTFKLMKLTYLHYVHNNLPINMWSVLFVATFPKMYPPVLFTRRLAIRHCIHLLSIKVVSHRIHQSVPTLTLEIRNVRPSHHLCMQHAARLGQLFKYETSFQIVTFS